MTKWISPPFYGFFLMMIYAALMGKDGLKEYPIGNPSLLWEEYLIILGLTYLILIVRTIWRKINEYR